MFVARTVHGGCLWVVIGTFVGWVANYVLRGLWVDRDARCLWDRLIMMVGVCGMG